MLSDMLCVCASTCAPAHSPLLPVQVDKLYATKKMTKQDREAAKVGRLESKVLQQLMDEHAQ
jgi:hypothetical protein